MIQLFDSDTRSNTQMYVKYKSLHENLVLQSPPPPLSLSLSPIPLSLPSILPLSHTLSHSLTLSHTLSHSLTLSHTLSHSLTLSHTLSHSLLSTDKFLTSRLECNIRQLQADGFSSFSHILKYRKEVRLIL